VAPRLFVSLQAAMARLLWLLMCLCGLLTAWRRRLPFLLLDVRDGLPRIHSLLDVLEYSS